MSISIYAGCLALAFAAASVADELAVNLSPAEEILLRNGVDINGRYEVIRHVPYESGAGMILVHQVHEGLVVFDSEAAFHYASDGKLRRTDDGAPLLLGIVRDVDRVVFDSSRIIEVEKAIDIFRESARFVYIPDITGRSPGTGVEGPECAQRPETVEAELGIYRETVVWRVRCRDQEYPLMYVGASDGGVLSFDAGYRS